MPYSVYFNFRNNENKPVRKKGGWFDIPLAYDLYFKVGEIVKITFDLRVKMSEGFEAIIQPRSSTLEKTGLISSGFGVIEDSYCGESDFIGYRFFATKDGFVPQGSCLVQMRFQEKMKDCVVFRAGDDMFEGVKSRGGFGSTDESKETHINKLNWEPEPKAEYQQGFSTGFDEGHMDGYDEGFRDGYDRCIDDLSSNFIEAYKPSEENEDYDHLVKVKKRDFDLGFSDGFDSGYNRCIEDLKMRLTRKCVKND